MPSAKKDNLFGKKEKTKWFRIQVREYDEATQKEKNVTSFTIYGVDEELLTEELKNFLAEKFGQLT